MFLLHVLVCRTVVGGGDSQYFPLERVTPVAGMLGEGCNCFPIRFLFWRRLHDDKCVIARARVFTEPLLQGSVILKSIKAGAHAFELTQVSGRRSADGLDRRRFQTRIVSEPVGNDCNHGSRMMRSARRSTKCQNSRSRSLCTPTLGV